MPRSMTIGRVATAAGCKVQTVRYYEQVGLLPAPPRTEGNQRLYADTDVRRLMFIRHARGLGFPLDAIRSLLSLSDRPDQSCESADSIARAQLIEVERRLAQLNALKAELGRMLDRCRGGRISDCRVIEALGSHTTCLLEDHASVSGHA